MPHDYKALAARVTKLEGGVALAQSGALVAMDAVHQLGTALDVDMPLVFRNARSRLHWLKGQVALKDDQGQGQAFRLPALPGTAKDTKATTKGARKQRVCVVQGSHQICKDKDGVKIRKLPRRGTHSTGAVHAPGTPGE
jgi:hypothetical protein